jgi:hypothetical protein
MGGACAAQYKDRQTRGIQLMKSMRSRTVLAGCLLLCAAAVIATYSSDASAKSPKKIQVRSHVDPAAQFPSYRSYGFVSIPGTNIERKINGVDPFAYLVATLQAIAAGPPMNRIDHLTPWTFAEASSRHP